ncbi:MAG: M3 family oligoendopeptidase [Anaerolineales bacterium]|jgi:oligoendopeptidase F
MSSKTYKQERWSLADLFESLDSPEVEQSRQELETILSSFEGYREKLSPELEDRLFLSILEDYEKAVRVLSRLGAYGSLRFSEDTQDQAAQTFQAQMQQLSADVDNRMMFFTLWWKGLEDVDAQRLLDVSGDYRYWLEALRLKKPYTLTEPEEKVINIKDVNGPQALVTLYQSITNRYTFPLEVDGEVKELTRGELAVYARSPEADLREASYRVFNEVYDRDAVILGQIYQFIARDWRSEGMDLRGYASPISIRNIANDVPDEVVDTLLEVCQKNVPLFHRFFRLKAKWIGMQKLRRYDIYAPVVKTEKTYDFNQAVDMVLDSFAEFDPRVAELAQKVLDERHYDSEVRKGKRSGAFCATVTPALTPWVLQSYQGKPENIATMAHELGHAVHSLLANHHTALTQHSSLPLAETASTFGEMLLIDKLLSMDPDEEVQRDLLFRQMDDAYATIMRQAYFALFERRAHEQIAQGARVDELSALYLENLKDQFGDSLELSEDFRVEWVAIPHFYFAPFYVYAYSFGQLLVLSLYQRFLEQGDAFKSGYLELLAAGGSRSPEQILTQAGFDVRSESFWQGGFDVLKASLERLEALEIPS